MVFLLNIHSLFYSWHVDLKRQGFYEVQSNLNLHFQLSIKERNEIFISILFNRNFLLHNVHIHLNRNFQIQKNHVALPKNENY
jgi:hypothetical protein